MFNKRSSPSKQVERTQHEAGYAGRRYMNVDPENRFVADSLEADWYLI